MANEAFKNCFLYLVYSFGETLMFDIFNGFQSFFLGSNCSNFGQWAFLQAGSHVLLKGPRFLGYFQTLLSQDVTRCPKLSYSFPAFDLA